MYKLRYLNPYIYIFIYTPVKPYIKEIYRLINMISDCHTVVRVPGYLDITQEKIAIKMKAIFNQCIICVNNTIQKFYRPRITKQIALFCTKEALIGEAITSYSSHKRSTDWYSPLGYKQAITQIHSYDIFVANTCPKLRFGLNKDIILILRYINIIYYLLFIYYLVIYIYIRAER